VTPAASSSVEPNCTPGEGPCIDNQTVQVNAAKGMAQTAQPQQAERQQQPQPQQKSLASTQELKFKTVSRGTHSWSVRWGLTHKSGHGGWIVQHITINVPAQGDEHARTYNYWEAWRVPASSRFTATLKTYGYDDEYSGPSGTTFYGQARFYEGLTLPSSFTVQPPGFPAGVVPATTENPNLPTVDATAINKRWWEAQ
jgi:hypothetical protein